MSVYCVYTVCTVCVCTVYTVCVCVRFMYAKFAISHSLLMSVEQLPPLQSTAGDPSTALLRMTLPALRISLPMSLRTTLLLLRTTSSPARRIAGNLQVGFFLIYFCFFMLIVLVYVFFICPCPCSTPVHPKN